MSIVPLFTILRERSEQTKEARTIAGFPLFRIRSVGEAAPTHCYIAALRSEN
jgi:hypothetical protein